MSKDIRTGDTVWIIHEFEVYSGEVCEIGICSNKIDEIHIRIKYGNYLRTIEKNRESVYETKELALIESINQCEIELKKNKEYYRKIEGIRDRHKATLVNKKYIYY